MKSKGFTLIELLAVIGITVITIVIATFFLVELKSVRNRAKDAARIANIKSFKLALQMYYNDNNGYPTSSIGNGDVLLNDPTLTAKLIPTYISSISPLLVSDGVRYYTNGITTGVAPNYSIMAYVGNSWCSTGALPENTSDWGIPTVCNF